MDEFTDEISNEIVAKILIPLAKQSPYEIVSSLTSAIIIVLDLYRDKCVEKEGDPLDEVNDFLRGLINELHIITFRKLELD